jgi:hypothetical protein
VTRRSERLKARLMIVTTGVMIPTKAANIVMKASSRVTKPFT